MHTCVYVYLLIYFLLQNQYSAKANTCTYMFICACTGDSRVDENIGLSSMHTMMMREHNRLARALAKLNPKWSGEILYQEARKIMGGYLQVCVLCVMCCDMCCVLC